jgi:hypothetical protein
VRTQIVRSHPIWTLILKRQFKRMSQRLFNYPSFSAPRTRPQVIVCSGEHLAIGATDMGHPPVMISSLRLFIVPRLIPVCSHQRL